MANMSDYLENKVIDWIIRAQAFSPPSPVYVALFTVTPSDSGGGTEVAGNNYARVAVTSSLANWAGTQGSGTTTASTGTNGTTSNNAQINFPTPSASWGTVVAIGIFDALTNGNLLFWGPLTINKVINNGDVVDFPAATLTIQIDN
jgi:hypothetical protein